MTFIPTEEQSAIVRAAVETSDNILISALAGAAKTSTLQLICEALPTHIPILSLAFNKRIALEMEKRLPSHVKSATINAIGHRVWASTIGRRLTVETKKTFNILSQVAKDRRRRDSFDFGEMLRVVGAAKMNGYIPRGKYPGVVPLISEENFANSIDEEVDLDILDEVMFHSIQQAYDGLIDFDDQVLMSTLFGSGFPRFPTVGIDEAQDLSPLNHAFLEKLVTGRLFAVGDHNQSIYAFRGAMTDSMERLKIRFSMREMHLSISFRCPRKIIERAWFRAPTMRWPEWAIEGEVKVLKDWFPVDDAVIICRNNAPLFKCAMALIRAGKGVKLVGADIGPGLIKILKKLGPESLSQEDTLLAIEAWKTERLRKKKAREGSIEDKADCLRVFAEFGETLGAAIAYAEHLFASAGPIQLMSGHKSKGLEFDHVYHLDPWRIPSKFSRTPEDKEQEQNVKYVIETRAKRVLYLVDLENLRGSDDEEAESLGTAPERSLAPQLPSGPDQIEPQSDVFNLRLGHSHREGEVAGAGSEGAAGGT